MSLVILTQAELYEQMKAFILANQGRITDFNEGSTLDTQLKAFSTQINQALVKASGGFKTQFEQIPFQVFDFNRKVETKASSTVVFSRQTADPVQINIPAGTKVGTVGGLLYTTQAEAIILTGNLNSSTVNVIADEAGSSYNAQIGEISVINSSVDGINSVVNNSPAAGGTDRELNSDYFSRFTNFIQGLSGSNRYGVFTAAVSVSTIQSAFIENHFPPELDLYNFTIYVDDGSGSVPQAKLDEIELVLAGNDTSLYQGYVAAGINFQVLSAGLIPIDIEYTIEIDAVSFDPDAVEAEVLTTITSYINSLWVGSDVIRAELIKLIQSLDSVLNTTALTLNTLSADVTVLPSQVARVNTITANIS